MSPDEIAFWDRASIALAVGMVRALANEPQLLAVDPQGIAWNAAQTADALLEKRRARTETGSK